MTHHALLLASIACFVLTVAVSLRLLGGYEFKVSWNPSPLELAVILLIVFAPPLAGITLLIAYLAQI